MLIFLVILAAIFGFIAYYYNACVRAKQILKEAESGIDVQLKRRHDLIPNLVEIVKGYMQHERNALENVTRFRGQATTTQTLEKRAEAENQLTKGLRTIFALSENYPNLKADSQFINLHNNLIQVEDELQMARRYYNGCARDLNVLVQSFPSNIIANIFRFNVTAFFELETATERSTPQVNL